MLPIQLNLNPPKQIPTLLQNSLPTFTCSGAGKPQHPQVGLVSAAVPEAVHKQEGASAGAAAETVPEGARAYFSP